MFYVRGFHSETNTGPCVFALCYFYEMLFFIFDLLSSTPFTAPGIPVSEEAAETMWCAVTKYRRVEVNSIFSIIL